MSYYSFFCVCVWTVVFVGAHADALVDVALRYLVTCSRVDPIPRNQLTQGNAHPRLLTTNRSSEKSH